MPARESRLDEAQLFRKAADYCAAEEHCASEVSDKLKRWGAGPAELKAILSRLLKEGFIDEKRYALAFARGKFRMNHWGKLMINFELKKKQVPGAAIREALESIDPLEYMEQLRALLTKKLAQGGATDYQEKMKAARYASSKGYEPELVMRVLNDLEN